MLYISATWWSDKVDCSWHQHVNRRSFKSCGLWGGAAADWTCSSTSSDILLPVRGLSLLGPLSIGTHHRLLGAPHKLCHFGDALTQSFGLYPTHWLQELTVLLLSNISQTLTLQHFCEIIKVICFICEWSYFGLFFCICVIYWQALPDSNLYCVP